MNRISARNGAFIALVVLVALVAVACGSPAASTPVVQTVVVPQTVVAPQTVAVPQTVVVQPTGAPTAGPTTPAQAIKGGKVTVAFYQEPDSLGIPKYSQMSFSVYADELCCTGLWNWDDKGNMEPELAAQIPTADNGGISADGKSITIKLRDGLKWQDGQPITSDDIKFTIAAVQNPNNKGISSRYGFDKSAGGPYITSVDTPDPQTAVVHYSEPYAPWAADLGLSSNSGMGLQPAHLLKDKQSLDKDPYLQKPVGAGPFTVTEWVSGDHITMMANPNYWRGKPNLDEIDIKIVPSREAGLAAVQTGDVDLVEDTSEGNIPTVEAMEPKVHLVTVPGSEFEHLLFNLDTKLCPPFFQDFQVRKAIMLGIDSDT
ncbi:MAG: ABC transporter substrate-binding protein, partial [Rudaea sp.]